MPLFHVNGVRLSPGPRAVTRRDRLGYTLVCLAIFLVCSQLPLYGVKSSAGADPFYWARVIMASSRGTVMELGIGPTITAGLVTQLLSGSKIIDVDYSVKSDRDLMCVPEGFCSGSLSGFVGRGGRLGTQRNGFQAHRVRASLRLLACLVCFSASKLLGGVCRAPSVSAVPTAHPVCVTRALCAGSQVAHPCAPPLPTPLPN